MRSKYEQKYINSLKPTTSLQSISCPILIFVWSDHMRGVMTLPDWEQDAASLRYTKTTHYRDQKIKSNLAKLDDGLAESPTVMVVDKTKNRKPCENRGILKPSWAFVETNIYLYQGKMGNFRIGLNENPTGFSEWCFAQAYPLIVSI